MSYTRGEEDWDTLPAALLSLAKQHMRIIVSDDDALITEYLGMAIDYCQTRWGLQVFGADVTWLPDDTSAARLQCPVWPVSAFTVTSDAVDVSSEYVLQSADLTCAPWLVHSDETAFPTDAEIELTVGYADAASLHPKMKGNILSIAATIYEHRETITTESLDGVAFWLDSMMGGLWVPRA